MIEQLMYLIDTNIISELRKKNKANAGVKQFFKQAIRLEESLFISVITVGELRRGVEIIRHRGDKQQAEALNKWLESIIREFTENILSFTESEAQIWGYLRAPHYENSIGKQIAATALTHDMAIVTRNVQDFKFISATVINPWDL